MDANIRELLERTRPIVAQTALMFRDVPDGLNPMFYHTLSAEGDRAARDRYCSLLADIDHALGRIVRTT